jgi:hypothetical protein
MAAAENLISDQKTTDLFTSASFMLLNVRPTFELPKKSEEVNIANRLRKGLNYFASTTYLVSRMKISHNNFDVLVIVSL